MTADDADVVDHVTRNDDFYHHGLEHAGQAADLDAGSLDRFCVVGAPERCIERLQALLKLDLSHLILVGASRDIDPTVRERSDHMLATEVLPALKELDRTT